MSIVTGVDFVSIPTSDFDRALDFYGEVLGLERSSVWQRGDEPAVGAEFETGTVTLAVMPSERLGIPFQANKVPVALHVDDVEAARAELIERGVDVSDVFHGTGFSADDARHLPGPDPKRESYGSFATFRDPDGNEFLLQEVTKRLPGRVEPTGVGRLADLLLETAMHHDGFEKAAPAHNWWDWYAPYLAAREQGSTSEQATASADRYMEETHGIVRSR
jgi:catechol 2,3-dioxygenase-like lactoylglutathione lyase family enzyme